MYRPIRDYGIIGNLRSAVLVSKDGSIDWAPAPFIDSPSVFAALLDDERGGHFVIQPKGAFTSRQHYLENTNVLVTKFTCENGSVLEVTDFIPIEAEKTYLPPEKETTFKIKRRMHCTQGTCDVWVLFKPRFNYARGDTLLESVDTNILATNKEMRGILVSHVDFTIDQETASAWAHVTMEEGSEDFLVFRYNTGNVDITKDNNEHHEQELSHTISQWQAWSSKCELDHCVIPLRWKEHIMRSALVLKILFFEPVGTVSAAATTSLPEWVGGVRNWDYRFMWLRDSVFTFNALFRVGHISEAKQYLAWLIELCATSKPEELRIMYGLRGEKDLEEYVLAHLKGYKESQPVRIGNGAYLQKQWDIYGSILDMVWHLYSLTNERVLDERAWKVLRGLANHVVTIWQEPDEGLWEVRGGAKHFVYSKVMCWVALDRALKLMEAYGFEGEKELWEKERDSIYETVLTRGFNQEKNSFVQALDGVELDTALLLLPRVGFIAGNDPKMLGTIECIQKELSFGEGLLLRYSAYDGLPGAEGAFLLASFWLVDALWFAEKKEEARAMFEKVISMRSDLGLFSEEINPKSMEFLGNFPQAYTHIGLINSALLLDDGT